MSAFQHPQIVGRNASRAIMRQTVELHDRLGPLDRNALGFKALLSGERLARVGIPDYGDKYPTPGAAKVPEIIKGALHNGSA